MKRFFALLAILLFAQGAFALYAMPMTIPVKIYTEKGEVQLNLEIAATPQARETGLMNRTALMPTDGMLFLFPKTSTTPFWMKNTILSLDIIFVSAEGRITYIGRNTTPKSLTPIGNGVPYQTTIEIAGGRAMKENIQVGNKVEFKIPEFVHVE